MNREIFDFIDSNSPIKIEYCKIETEECESLSIKFLHYLYKWQELIKE